LDWFRGKLKERLARQQVRALFNRRTKNQETRRFRKAGKAPKYDAKLYPWNEYPSKDELRAQLAAINEYRAFVTDEVRVCPPETTTEKLNRRRVGAPLIGERKMTNAEYQKRWRDKQKLLRIEAPPLAPQRGDDHVHSLTERTDSHVENLESPRGRKAETK
jgi:hypothetical protein